MPMMNKNYLSLGNSLWMEVDLHIKVTVSKFSLISLNLLAAKKTDNF